MKQKIQKILGSFVYSLPVQLLVIQIRNQKSLLILWLILMGIVSGFIGESFGMNYLFLEPEYLGQENFWSVFIVGSALGGFLFAYMITLYINESYRFHFIALTGSPFLTFSYNNFLIPGTCIAWIGYQFIEFQVQTHEGFSSGVAEKVMGLLLGISVVFILSVSYFFASKSLIQRFGNELQRGFIGKKNSRNLWIILGKARQSYRSRQRADYYIRFPFDIKPVEELGNIEFRNIVGILSQNHGKLLTLQILTFLLIAVLSLLEGGQHFQIPAGATLLLIFSLVLMTSGAVIFWFRKVGVLAFAVVLAFLFLYDRVDFLHEQNHAFGLNYDIEPALYEEASISVLHNEANYEEDRAATIASLENWKDRYQGKYGKHTRPKAVFVMASGGGLRSSYWTFNILQRLDSLTSGNLSDEIRLMTGASGGMLGLAYFRELYQLRQEAEIEALQDSKYADNISQDLLNRIIFKVFTDIFLPNQSVQIDGKSYDRETGYVFDRQLAENMPEFAGKRLGDYRLAEQEGRIPMLLLTPTILNQGRKLYIAASPVSFLSRPAPITNQYASKTSGVEFRRLFAQHGADSLLMTTALRMNATFPFILPTVELPSQPPMEVMDAGAMDNYGMQSALQYLFEFKDWFAQNTDGVVFVQIRDNEREDPILDPSRQNTFGKMLNPLGGGYNSLTESRDMSNDYQLEYMRQWYKGFVEVVAFEYPRETSDAPASLSWHLTAREKQNILKSLDTPKNQQSFEWMKQLYKVPELIVEHR